MTQVVGPLEGHIFHNRLTHTLEVAQIARRLGERLIATQPELARAAHIDIDVLEAAALAHDLGHPPFGHVAEDQLRELATLSASDGFEGNAQSFRILTRLAAHREGYKGLNLTRATLNAVLKYPWHKADADPAKPNKFSAYDSEHQELVFARTPDTSRLPSLEASIMDHADDIAYSVHDVDDFFRAGLIPLDRLRPGVGFDGYVDALRHSSRVFVPREMIDLHIGELRDFAAWMPDAPYEGTFLERGEQRARTSQMIGLFISAASLREENGRVILDVPGDVKVQMKFLQNLVWMYVIDNPRLATQQHGQREVIKNLFSAYRDAVDKCKHALIPTTFRAELDTLGSASNAGPQYEQAVTRIAVDIVASFTDAQAIALHRRLFGVALGSVTDILDG